MPRTWLQEFMYQSRESESPRRYFYWAGLSVISAILGRKAYVDRHFYKLYPNMYVVLVGRSGLRKGIPVSAAQSLVKKASNIKVIGGRSSIQAIIQELARSEIKKDGTINKGASGYICSGEMSQSLLQDDQALTILTNLYDGHYNEEFVNLLKSGNDSLKDVYLCMLGASNETHLNAMITKRDMMGGFVARTIMVVETTRANINSLMYKPESTIDIDGLAEYLSTLSTHQGEFILRDDARTYMDEWYKKSVDSYVDDDTGFGERLQDHAIKVAMCLSAARDYSRIITDEDIAEGIEVCEECMGSSKRVTMRSSANADSQSTAVVLQALLSAEGAKLSRQTLLKRFWKEGVTADVLSSIVGSLENADVLSLVRQENDIFYQLKEWFVIQYHSKLKEKKS